MCSKAALLNGLFLGFYELLRLFFFCPGGRRGSLEHVGGAVNVI